MGFVPEKKEAFDNLWKTAQVFADHITEVMGEEGFIYISSEEGSDEDPAGLVYIDIPSFSTISMNGKSLFETLVRDSDAVNFYVTKDGWIQITLAIENEWEQETNPYETDIVEIQRAK